ncbi:hypothetical protein BDY19DRAFT_902660 [Irpex rosettiformis]|uniref:Uncharacterized protein n=1 Tax=Irpex rosettiformis TaxID=378272 RepID=A0ACB8UIG6_9APHY|nr:hypothetical protein BDY19DRAFT_902660 [Irpex rosettiformis]
MPSLRRTLSAPSRSSPYSSSTQTRTGSRSPRRSSGSDTANRRVLADIDWWRVEEGQREVRGLSFEDQLRPATPSSDEEELDQEERAPSPVAASLFQAPTHNVGSDTDLPLWHNVPGAGWDAFDGFELPSADVSSQDPFEMPSTLQQFAALSLNPVGRASLHRSVSSSSAFSDTSSDSSYSTPTGSSASLSLGFEDFAASPADDSDDDNDVPQATLFRSPRRPSVARAPTFRSFSYSAVESELSSSRDLFSYFGDDDDDDDSFDSSFENSRSNEDTFF